MYNRFQTDAGRMNDRIIDCRRRGARWTNELTGLRSHLLDQSRAIWLEPAPFAAAVLRTAVVNSLCYQVTVARSPVEV